MNIDFKALIDQILLYFFRVFAYFGLANDEDIDKFEDEYVNADKK